MTRPWLRILPLAALSNACVIGGETPEPDDDSGAAESSSEATSATTTSTPDESSSSAADSSDGSTDDGPIPTDCPAPTSGPTMHPGNNVEAAEVWTADGSPHLVPYDFTIHAPVLIEACARVQLGKNLTLTIGEGGSLVADGNADAPVVIERLDPERWSTIRLIGGEAQLFYTVLDGGGAVGNGLPDLTGALFASAPSGATMPTDVLRLHSVEIRDSEAAGLRLDGFGGVTADSEGLTITGGASHPISASATMVGTIPTGTYVGNADDRIVLTTSNTEAITFDATMRNHGVPYFVGLPGQVGDLRVQANGGGLAVLTIEPGVELQFQQDGVLTIEHASSDAPATGALVAVGSPDDRILLTSASDSPAAGDWLGVYLGSTLAAVDRIDYVDIEYAGGASVSGSNSCPYPGVSINDAAIRVFGVPPGAFITNTIIAASASNGIDRGWRDDYTVDLVDTNSFDVVGCTQTWSRLYDGTCPDVVPCP